MMGIGFERRHGQGCGELDFPLPDIVQAGNVRTELEVQTLFQGAAVIAFAIPVRQPRMMSGDAKRHQLADDLPAFNGNFRASRGVINPPTTVQTGVEVRAVFVEVVQLSGTTGDVLRAEIFRE